MTTSSPPRRLPRAPLTFTGSVAEVVETVLLPVLPPVEAVVRFHDALFGYLHSLRPSLWFETPPPGPLVQGLEANGAKVRECDDAPAVLIHALLCTGAWPNIPFADLLATLPTQRNALPPATALASGWQRTLLLPLAATQTPGTPDRRVLARRMVRSLHPCNQVWVPAKSGVRLSGDPDFRAYLASFLRQRYRGIWSEFLSLAGNLGPLARPAAGAVSIGFPDADLPPRDVASSEPHQRVAVGAHFLCPDGGNVLDFGDGTFETGAWSVPRQHRTTLRTVALHPTKATRSTRHGKVVGLRTLVVDDEERVIFRVRQVGQPVEWRGGGAGNTGYAWAVLREAGTRPR